MALLLLSDVEIDRAGGAGRKYAAVPERIDTSINVGSSSTRETEVVLPGREGIHASS
jgi:hypothetical protein